MDFLLFLGRFHVLALHVPIGLVLVGIALDFVARQPSRHALAAASAFLWGIAAISAIGSAMLGYAHFLEGGFASRTVVPHMVFGTGLAVLITVSWQLRSRRGPLSRGLENVLATLALVLVVLTGHFGGTLTHGSTYLSEYAPGPIRALAGLEPRRPPVTVLGEADVYLDVIQPLFNARCTSCHGLDRRRGELSLADYDSLRRGGETGSVIVPGRLEASELHRRITLPPEDEAFMPAEGKTPLTPAETAVIAWWIAVGAPSEGRLAEFEHGAIETELRAALGLDGSLAPLFPRTIERVAADPAIVAQLSDAGFNVRQVSMQDPRLIVSLAYARNSTLSEAGLAALSAASEHIVELNLRSSGVDDAMLERIGKLSNLTHLYLDENAITDASLVHLANLDNLVYLNLVSNAGITDAAVDVFALLPRLERLFVWNTAITATGRAVLIHEQPLLAVYAGAALPLD